VLVPQIKRPEDEVTTTPSGRVLVDTGAVVEIGSPVGWNVKVSPSVVTTSAVVKPVGIVTVLVPHIKRPEEEVTTTPSGNVSVDTPDVCVRVVVAAVEGTLVVEVKVTLWPLETVVLVA